MGAINVLIVGDGPFMDNSRPALGINFAPKKDSTDRIFTVTEFRYLLNTGAVPSIALETAHRRDATYPNFVSNRPTSSSAMCCGSSAVRSVEHDRT